MGIPRLIGHLEPFASTAQFTADNPRAVVVDGPGLAFHVTQLALRASIQSSRTRLPSYREITEEALRWLRSLRSCGLKIRAIYFDGFLPDYKKAERCDRLSQVLIELRVRRASGIAELLAKRGPFIVPAVMEGLLASEFSPITAVIPGEADPWCAEHARIFGSIIFTGDSDLLAHNLGLRGSVAYFNTTDVGDSMVETLVFTTSEIADRLGLASLRSFACVLLRDRHRPLNELVRAAIDLEMTLAPIDLDDHGITNNTENSPIDKNTSLYAQNMAAVALEPQHIVLQNVLSTLDPRISEIVHQVLSCQYDPSLLRHLIIYLPPLLDDIYRAPAWNCGAHIRQVGYSILAATLTSKPQVIYEMRRSGQRMAEKECPLVFDIMIIANFAESIQNWLDVFAGLPTPCLWRLFGIHCMWQDLSENDACFLLFPGHLRQILGGDSQPSTWFFRHIDAQLQAILYSLRMVQRFTTVYLACLVEQRNQVFTKVVGDLHDSLTTLPPLIELIPQDYAPALEENQANQQVAEAITNMYEMLGVEGIRSAPGKPEKEKKKKNRRKANSNGVHPHEGLRPEGGNMYTLLERH